MATAIGVRSDYTSADLQGFARSSRDASQVRRVLAEAINRSGAVGLGRVRDQRQQADVEPGASRHGVSQAVGAAASSCPG